MGTRGRKRRLDLEGEYWRLLSAGMGTVEACKEIGVGRKTGFRWRQENGGPTSVSASARTSIPDGISRISSANGSRALAERGHGVAGDCAAIGTMPRRPSPVSCAATDRGMTEGAMTAIWRMPAHANERSDPESPGWAAMRSSARSWRTSSNSSGAPNRSPFISGVRTRLGPNGTSVLKRSTRLSTCPEEVV